MRLCGASGQLLLQAGANRGDEAGGVHRRGLNTLRQMAQIAGHNAALERLQAGLLQLTGKGAQGFVPVQLTALAPLRWR